MCLAVPGIIDRIEGFGAARLATVVIGSATRRIGLALVPDAAVGDWVLFHGGQALRILDRDHAEDLLALIERSVSG